MGQERRWNNAVRLIDSNHPHICTLYDVGRQDDIAYLVMEPIEEPKRHPVAKEIVLVPFR